MKTQRGPGEFCLIPYSSYATVYTDRVRKVSFFECELKIKIAINLVRIIKLFYG